MTLQKFKALVRIHGGTFEKDGDTYKAWWDAYGGKESYQQLYMCFGRLLELTDLKKDFLLVLVNWIHWTPGTPTPKCLRFGKV